jgi:cytochrome P450
MSVFPVPSRQVVARPAGPRGVPLLGVLPDLQRRPLEFVVEVLQNHGDLSCTRFANKFMYFVNHPDLIKHLLQDNVRYTRGDLIRQQFQKISGANNIITSTGEDWNRLRRLMQPAFNRAQLDQLTPLMSDVVVSLRDRWQQLAAFGQPVDVYEEMKRVTMNIASNVLFGTRADEHVETVARELTVIQKHMNQMWRWTEVGMMVEKLPLIGEHRFLQSVKTLRDVVRSFIDARARQSDPQPDLLSMLMKAKDPETGESFNEDELLSQVVSVFLAGYESTAATMGWVWHFLATHVEVARKLRVELDEVLGGRLPTAQDLPKLVYSKMILEEVLRLYPPVWMFSRTAMQDDQLGQYAIPKGSLMFVSPYAMHRHTDYWKSPEAFDPERFRPEAVARRPRYAYLPFGGGPQVCIGLHFTFLEAQLILATLAQSFVADLVPGRKLGARLMVLLQPGPQWMTLRAR